MLWKPKVRGTHTGRRDVFYGKGSSGELSIKESETMTQLKWGGTLEDSGGVSTQGKRMAVIARIKRRAFYN